MTEISMAIIIPVRREEDNIIQTLEAIRKSVKTSYRVYVVDDAISPEDRTAEVVTRYIKSNRNVRVINKKPEDKSGFWQALNRGVIVSGEPYILFMMADLCDNPEDIDIMLRMIRHGYDCICGSRYVDGGSKEGGPGIQGFFSGLVNKSMRLLLNLPTHDVSNAFKLYRREVILPNLGKMTSSGLEASMELYLHVYFGGMKSVDIPTHWKGRIAGDSKFNLFRQAPVYIYIYLWAIKQKIMNIFNN